MQRFRKATPWLLGILIASLLFAALLAFSNYQYIGSDDTPILRSFMGYEGGEPATFHLYLHTAFAWLLWSLSKLFPGVAWFSILQLTLLWFSQVVIVKSLVQLSLRRGWHAWPGALAGVAFLAAFTVYVTCRISYTTTAAIVGAAAVAQLISVDFAVQRNRSVLGPILGSAALLLCAYCLRQISVLPPLCFWALALGVKLLASFGKHKRPWRLAKPVFTGMLVTALLFGLFAGVRAVDIRLNHAEAFLKWQNERIKLFDYTDYDSTTTPETLQKLGWSDSEFTLFSYWYFMDDNISTAALETLNAQQTADDAGITPADRIAAMGNTVASSLQDNPATGFGFGAALAMAAAALFATMLRRKQLWAYLGIVLAVVGGALLLCYLGWTGRLPMRAAMSVLFPMAAYLFAALFGFTDAEVTAAPPRAKHTITVSVADSVEPETDAGSTAGAAVDIANRPLPLAVLPMAVSLLVCLWFMLGILSATATSLQPTLDEQGEDALTSSNETLTDLDTYAAENPDTLFITDLSLVSDHRLFPDTSAGIPGNVMFWGGYPARSPSWYRMLAKYGITELNASIFLRDNVLLASTDPEPWPSLMSYVAEYGGEPVDWDYADSLGYVNFFRIYQ